MAEPDSRCSPDPVNAGSGAETDVSSAPRRAARGRGPGAPAVLALILAALFGVLTWQVVTGGPVTALDRLVRDAVLRGEAASAGTPVTPVAQLLSDAANWPVAGAVLLVAAAVSGARGREVGVWARVQPLVRAAVLSAVGLGVTVWLKHLVGRPGPVLDSRGTEFFPSGHMVTAVVCFGAAVMLLAAAPRAGRTSASAAAPSAGSRVIGSLVIVVTVLCVGVGCGLVWCEYHWLSDVPAGAALGGALLCGLRLSYRTPVAAPGAGDGPAGV